MSLVYGSRIKRVQTSTTRYDKRRKAFVTRHFVGHQRYASRFQRGRFCFDCKRPCVGADYYMVKDQVWETVVPDHERSQSFCWTCLEARAKRPLDLADLSLLPASQERYYQLLLKAEKAPTKLAKLIQLREQARNVCGETIIY